ncbi:TonB-dependent receptor [Archangium lipolyticum]|uniref:TonB-dependent receptor n=1 Tax=Archangium lipolyticum TaxID=2970465 RepID=UPI00214A8983|nr:TonB-dependent siderophore receptor [Archangium lipolyticum]
MTSPKHGKAGIRSTKGHPGGVRGALRPWSQAAVGLASALAASGAVAQETAGAEPRKPAEDHYVLPTVQVVGESEAESYNTQESSLTRLPKPLVDTPQTVTVVPEKLIEEQNATTVRDALRNVSGITISAGEGGRQGDNFILRGFSAQTDVSRDGVRDLGWYTRDTFNIGGVEVFFGPSSVLFGRGSTGGAINLATKKPVKRSFQELSLTGGTAPWGRVEVDVNQVITDSIQVRVNGTGQLSKVAGRDLAEQNRAGFAPSIRFELSKNTTLDVDYLYQREDSFPDYGHPYFNGYPVSVTLGVPRSAIYGVQGSDTERVNAHIGTARFQHRFGNGLTLTDTLRYGGVDRFSRPTSPRGLAPTDAPTTIGRERYQTDTDNTNLINQVDVRGEFQTAFLKHTANAGLELAWETRDQLRFNLTATDLTTGPNLPADLFDPVPSPDLSPVNKVFSTSNQTDQRTVGVYASDQIELTRFLEVLGSVRFDSFKTKYSSVNNANVTTRLENTDTFFNWRAGLVFHPLEKTSLYAMYGTSANPSAEAGTLPTGTESLEPEKNNIFEVGAKADLLDERLGLSAAFFRLDKTNARVPNTDPNGPPQILAGQQRVEGFNFGAGGLILERWRLIANYTFMDSEIREHTNEYLKGQQLPNTPKHSISLWTTVEVIDKLTLGGGAVYQDVTVVNNPTSAAQALNKVPNFWRFDAFASYAVGPVQLQLNVNNLTNELYYAQYYSGQAVPAETRSASLTGRVRF